MNKVIPTYEQMLKYVQEQFDMHYDHQVNLEHYFVRSELNIEDKQAWQNVLWFEHETYRYPVFYANVDCKDEGPLSGGKLCYDWVKAVFLMLSGLQEYLSDERDEQGRFPFKESLQYSLGIVKVPVVSIYFEQMAKVICGSGVKCERKDWESPIVFTHDIDQIRSGWFEDIGYALKYPSLASFSIIVKSVLTKVFAGKDSYAVALEKMLFIDREHQTNAINFLMTEKSHQDADYSLDLLKNYDWSAGPVGLHPGYYTYDDQKEWQRQFSKLENTVPATKKIARQHFLKYDIKQTLSLQENLGIEEDYSLGFAEHYGFRNGTSLPFKLYNFIAQRPGKVLQIPLYFMEGTIVHYMSGSSQQVMIEEVEKDLKLLLKTFPCRFSVLFHNTAFSDKKYKGFEALYFKMIAANQSHQVL